MEMKWNPIVNGDLSGVPKDKRLLFTGIDQDGLYVDFGYADSYLEKQAMISIGFGITAKAKKIIAWMEVPEPFKPKDCVNCPYWKEWTDPFGCSWFKCKLWGEEFTAGECPLNR